MVVSMRYIPLDQAWIYIRHKLISFIASQYAVKHKIFMESCRKGPNAIIHMQIGI